MRELAADGQIGFERVEVDGVPTLLVGGPTPGRDAELYFAFSEAAIRDDLSQLSTALLIGGLALVVVAFALARVAAGRIATLAEAEAWGRRFTSDVSHELRTPVAALVSEAEVLEEHLGAMPPEARRAAELLVGDVARLRALVEDLTNLASLDAGREQVRPERSTSRPSSRAPSGVGDGKGASTSGRRPIACRSSPIGTRSTGSWPT